MAAFALALALAGPAAAITYTLNRNVGGEDSNPGNGIAWSSTAGGITLHAAIEEANRPAPR